MKSKILFSILGMVLLISLAVGADLILSERTTTISETDKTALISKNITEVMVSNLDCGIYSCDFTMDINNKTLTRTVKKVKEVCVNTSIIVNDINLTKCYRANKTQIELIKERDALVDTTLSSLAKTVVITKPPITIIGTDEKVIIKEKIVIKK
jgi:hypothetical protein